MPFVRLDTTETIAPDRKLALCQELSRACAETIGKPEQYQMAEVRDGVTLCMGGAPGPAAFLEIRSIGGLTPAVNRKLAERLCALLAAALKIPGARVYLNMLDVAGAAWGHDGETFG